MSLIDTSLVGTWYSHFTTPAGNEHYLELNVKQFKLQLEGSMIVLKQFGGSGPFRKHLYDAFGQIRQSAIRLYGDMVNPEGLGTYIMLFEFTSESGDMKGIAVWYSLQNKVITSKEISWTRSRPDRMPLSD